MSRITDLVVDTALLITTVVFFVLALSAPCAVIYIAVTKGVCVTEFECAERALNDCLASERYTRAECLQLLGGDQ